MKKIFVCLVVLVLAACLRLNNPSPVATPQASDTPAPSPSNTTTVVWFPPTDTPVVTPTRELTPTPGLMVDLGEIIYEDHFTSSEGWILPQSGRGRISIGNGEMNIIINESGTYLAGTRDKPDVGDFYAEITANPVLCSSRDRYGFLFGVVEGIQYYSFGLSCSGEVRLERYDAGNIITLYPWTRNASVPVGAPSVTKLAVVAVDDEIHLYINGVSLLSIEGQQRRYGSFGVYARTVGETAMTVSFSDLIVREVIPK